MALLRASLSHQVTELQVRTLSMMCKPSAIRALYIVSLPYPHSKCLLNSSVSDIYAALRHADSCIGPNFQPNGVRCNIGNDICGSCTGVREVDYLNIGNQVPHTYTWMTQNCLNDMGCKGNVYSEAIWSLYKRELRNFYNYDKNTSLEIVQRLTYIAAGSVENWYYFSDQPDRGCGRSSGYLSFLEADDDDGDLSEYCHLITFLWLVSITVKYLTIHFVSILANGTPHMHAIYEAFNDQEIACDSPLVRSSGCAGTPTTMSAVTKTEGYLSVSLTWTPVVGATSYQIFRADGAKQCDQGKVLLDDIAFTTFTDTGLMNGHDYYYIVIPKGSNPACFGKVASRYVTDRIMIDFFLSPFCNNGVYWFFRSASPVQVC